MGTKFDVLNVVGDATPHTVQETPEAVTTEVNAALAGNLKFVTFTREDGKQFSIEASDIANIEES